MGNEIILTGVIVEQIIPVLAYFLASMGAMGGIFL
jgi:hypothetical protein